MAPPSRVANNGGGTVFKMTPDGALKTFHEFKDADLNEKEGRAPQSGLAWKDNYLYGTTSKGGAGGFGTIFKISPDGTTFTTLLRFSGREDGQNRGAAPLASLVLDKNKQYFYGTTSSGGKYGYGTAFKFSDDGTTVPSITTLVDFSGDRDPNPSDDHSVKGSASMASLVQDSDGNFYGTTSTGGTEGKGTVFKMTADGEATTLVDFNETTDLNDPKRGSTPMAGLVLSEGDAYIYGTTFGGGTNRKGTVFKIKPDGTAMRTLVDFTGYDSDPLETQRGSGPTANLLLNDGTIYGTTSEGGFFDKGTIFKLTLHPSPQLSTLLDFTGDGNMNRGSAPAAGLVMDQNGDSLYGTTKHGGNSEKGTVFKFSLGTDTISKN